MHCVKLLGQTVELSRLEPLKAKTSRLRDVAAEHKAKIAD